MPAPDSVLKLCETFADHRDHYRSGNYNEAQLRKEFLDPFFAALGWDMGNSAGLAPQYRDVIHEDALRVGVHVKAPDYGFTLHGQRKFFLEAKKPAVNIKSDVDPAYQLRRYAWSAKMPLSILSDFEEFAIYDTRIKPVKGDPSSKARTFYCTCDQYPEKWDEIAAIFSRDAILKGSFDKYAESNKRKKGTAEVDAEFLAEIERWRDLLARNLALRNPDLSVRDLNFAVQKTIDRLVFLRICEDRGTEDYGRLRSIANGTQTYPRLLELFRTADHRYNSGLFHFSKEKGQAEEPDTLTPHLLLDDKVLKDIITHLYYPESPYEFSVLPADILGSVYEQFLGKVITLKAGHRAVVEDKPEVKKAGGVFYTPSYIVDYIVKQTVGPLIEGKTPKQIESIRVLDPACGSGSFLIVAYQFLLDWYHQYYIAHDPGKLAKGKNPVLVSSRGGGWVLTTAERKRILLAHIYGVDIDSQAVEVTKLSLLLKVLEGETSQSVQRELIHQRVLPDLGNNIKCGNSLIGSDFYAQPGLPEMDTDARLRVNVFDWDGKDGFPEIMKAGGFDAVIGNPPYIRIQRIAHVEADYLFTTYETPTSKMDISLVFIEKALLLISERGRAAFICTSQWLSTDYGRKLRERLRFGELHQIVDFGSLPVFSSASTYPAIVTLSRVKTTSIEVKRITKRDDLNLAAILAASSKHLVLASLSDGPWIFSGFDLTAALAKGAVPVAPLRQFGKAYIGTKCGLNEAFVLSSEQAEKFSIESDILIPYAYRGGEVNRYSLVKPDAVIIYPYRSDNEGNPTLISESELKSKFPKAYAYLLGHKPKLRERQDSRRFYARGEDWYRHLRAGSFNLIHPKKLAVKGIALRCSIGLLEEHTTFDGARCPCIILKPSAQLQEEYVLGMMNSKLAGHYLKAVCPQKLHGYIEFTAKGLTDFPIRVIDPANKTDVAAHDRIVALVEKMLDLHKQRATAKTPHEQTALDRQISATDAQIDRLVYDLYGLTEDEIKLVEGA